MKHQNTITNESELAALIGESFESARLKVVTKLDSPMAEFIRLSPLIFVSTIDENNHVDVSPKGDPGGFVIVEDDRTLLIPERSGNRLVFGFKNILRNSQIGLIFLVPNQKETLRIKGRATLHTDPAILEKMAVKGKPALMYTRIEIAECFFHCGKALVRSKIWNPQSQSGTETSLAAKHFSELTQSDYSEVKTGLDDYYRKE